MRALVAALFLLIDSSGGLFAATGPVETLGKTDKKAGKKAAPRVGIKTPGVQIPFATLKSVADIPFPGKPAGLYAGEAVWVVDAAKESLVKIDPKTNKAGDPVSGLKKPCSGIASGFGTLLIPNCGEGTISRYDLKSGKITSTEAAGVASVRTGVAATADSIWILADGKSTLLRIDPETNKVVSDLRLPAACDSLLFAEKALWVTCPSENKVLRVDPETNLVVNRIEVAAKPHALAAGENSLWVLCLGEGKVARIDPKTNKVTKTIDMEVPNADGGLAFGEGFLWVTLTGFPLARIDATEEKVVQQFTGEGGGAVYVGLGSLWLVSTAENAAAETKIRRIDPKRVLATLAE